jgi:thymidine phosphorylase
MSDDWTTMKPPEDSKGASVDINKQKKILIENMEKAAQERIGNAAEAFNKYHLAYAKDHGLDIDELISAIYLEMLNCRQFHPAEHGGTPAFDKTCENVYVWFQELLKNDPETKQNS